MTDTSPEPVFHRLCRAGEIREKAGKCFVVLGRAVAVFLENGRYAAVSDRCPHNGMSLHDGEVRNGVVTCRWHGWQFNLASGHPPGASPEAEGPRIRVYSLRVADGWIEVSLDAPSSRPLPSSPAGE